MKGILGILLLCLFLALSLIDFFIALPLALFAVKLFAFFSAVPLVGLSAYEYMHRNLSEFSQMTVVSVAFVPLSIGLLHWVTTSTPVSLRAGIGPFAISLIFTGNIVLALSCFLVVSFLLMLPQYDDPSKAEDVQ